MKLPGTKEIIFKTCARHYFTDTFNSLRLNHINATVFGTGYPSRGRGVCVWGGGGGGGRGVGNFVYMT